MRHLLIVLLVFIACAEEPKEQIIWKWERGDPIENLPPPLRDEGMKVDTIYWSKEETDAAQKEWERRKQIDSLQAIIDTLESY